ncbi:MAG: DUF3179 domain-containing protein [Amphritea sp.]
MTLHGPHPTLYKWLAVLLLIVFCLLSSSLAARMLNGFDLSDSLIDASQIHHGGPRKDGIPAIDKPKFEDADQVEWLQPDSRVLGVVHNGIAKAYPIAILNWHEVVNDLFADEAVVITYCPLCGSGVVYRSEVAGRRLTFGVSGLLYNSDLLLYDRQTDSLWSQLHHQAISGEMKALRLMPLPSSHTSWAAWQQQYPDTKVLTRSTGYIRSYNRSPYRGYEESPRLFFNVEFMSRAYHPKERVLGVELDGMFKAFPFSELAKLGVSGEFEDILGDKILHIEYNAELRDGRVWLLPGDELNAVNLFWFAWYAFHPDTEVFKVKIDTPVKASIDTPVQALGNQN